jgi:predicted enzyme related to lactoylglutathione lyase
MDKVVHFEIPTDDLSRAKEFYGSVFGWDLQTNGGDGLHHRPDDFRRWAADADGAGAINGGMMKRSAETPSPVLTIGVESVDDSLKQLEGAGGNVVRPKTDIPGMGSFAYVKDTEGNVIGLWESAWHLGSEGRRPQDRCPSAFMAEEIEHSFGFDGGREPARVEAATRIVAGR